MPAVRKRETFRERCRHYGVRFAAYGLANGSNATHCRLPIEIALAFLRTERIGKVRNVAPNIWICE